MELATKEDLEVWKNDVIKQVTEIIKNNNPQQTKKWVKSKEARELLNCSPGTLQNLRNKKILEFSKIGGTFYYCMDSVMKTLEVNN